MSADDRIPTERDDATEPEPPGAAGTPLTSGDPSPLQRFRKEARDGITLRSALLVFGVFVLQMAFIASYVGAFHSPRPRRIPIAIVLPAGAPAAVTNQAVDRLNAIAGHPLHVRAASSEAEARRLMARRDISGALIISASGPDRMLVTSAGGGGRAAGEPVAGSRPIARAGDVRHSFGLGWRPHRPGRVFGVDDAFLPAVGSRRATRLAVGAFTMACQVLFGILGIGVAILLFVVLGNPSAGGAYPSTLLPTFWARIGAYLPPGAGTDAVRSIVYFSSAKITRDLLVLVAYAVIGVVVTYLFAGWRSAEPDPVAISPAAAAASPR